MKLDGWPTDEQLRVKLWIEAEQDASRLGHQLGIFVCISSEKNVKDRRIWRAQCNTCGANATISSRIYGTAPISGEAVGLRCKGK